MHDDANVTLEAASAAVVTLRNMGYTYEGGSLWKPPLGDAPAFTKPYTDWKHGDVLRVVRVAYLDDPFRVGDEVTHDDADGDPVPFVSGARHQRWAMNACDLEFVSRPV